MGGKLDKGGWKFPFACPTGRVDFLGILVLVCGKQKLTSVSFLSFNVKSVNKDHLKGLTSTKWRTGCLH